MLRRAVFLDRDGVLNESVVLNGKPCPPADADCMVIPPDVPDALLRLKKAGFVLICVTNQPDIARGTRPLENVEAMNAKIFNELPLDALYFCPHDGKEGCVCRKPNPGMLVRGAQEWEIDLAQSWMIGDRKSDIGAGVAAGCRCIFIQRGYEESEPDPKDTECFCHNLKEATAHILSRAVAGEGELL